MRCISQPDGIKLLTEIHRRVRGTHYFYKTLVGKAFRQGYYWPNTLHDAKKLVTKYVQYQFHIRQIYQPTQALQIIPLFFVFCNLGTRYSRTFPKSTRRLRILFIMIDTLTKWIEAKPIVKTTTKAAKRFLTKKKCDHTIWYTRSYNHR